MAQGKRASSSGSGMRISSGGKRAVTAKDHYNSISNKKRFIVFLSFFAIVVLFTGIAMAGSLKKLNELNDQKSVLVEQKEDLEITGETLSQEVEYINTKEFVEYMARKLLGWINPSDKKYIIVD